MKKLTGLVLILAVLVLGAYYGMGALTENTIKKNIIVINQSNGLFADLQDYKRGWFKSDANIKWRLHVPERVVKDSKGQPQTVAATDYKMDMPIKIYHGPFIFANKQLRFGMGYASSNVELPKELVEQFDTMFAKDSIKPQLDLSIFVNYFNRSKLGLGLPHFKLIAKDGTGTFDWVGMNSTTSISSKMDKVDGDIVIDGMNFNKDDTKVTLGKVSTNYNLHETLGGLFLGDASLDVPSFVVSVKDQKMFELNDFSMSSSSDVDDHLFSSHLNVELDSMIANGQNYGPAELELAIRKIDADVLAAINQQASAMQNATDTQKQQALLMMLPELPKLFNKGAEFEISKLTVKIPQGTIEGNLSLALAEGDAGNPFQIFQKLKGDAKLKVPAELVKFLMQQSLMQQVGTNTETQQALTQQLQQDNLVGATPTNEELVNKQLEKQIASLQQSGLVVVDGADYTLEATLDAGKLIVNGKPFDPSMLKF